MSLTPVWQSFVQDYNLSAAQQQAFKKYLDLLVAWNKKFNITAITEPVDIVQRHFSDSLALTKAIDMHTIQACADIGSGGGFPGIPLAICYPHLRVTLLEVNNKKVSFLQEVAHTLGLTQVTANNLDWRTFLRQTNDDIDLFCARASLQPEELVRMFSPSCHYNKATLVYWASGQWQPAAKEAKYIARRYEYAINGVAAQLIVFATAGKK